MKGQISNLKKQNVNFPPENNSKYLNEKVEYSPEYNMKSLKTESYDKGKSFETNGRKKYGNKVCNYLSVDYDFLRTDPK